MSPVLTAEIVRDEASLAWLEPEWWALWQQMPEGTPFQSPAWLIPWWDSFAPGALHIVAIRREGELAGLAPLYLETGPLGGRVLPIGIGITDYLGILLHPACAAAASAAIASAMARSALWQSWETPDLPPQIAALPHPCPAGCDDLLETGEPCPYLPLPQRPEELRSVVPARKRRAIAMSRHRAARRGNVTVLSLADRPVEAMLADLIRLHRLRWESRGQPGVLCDARVQAFHARTLPRLERSGMARLYALRIGEDVAAIYYGFAHRGHAYAYLTGMDPAFAHESPGTILLAHVIEDAVREGLREFHFLRGGEAYKYGWGAIDRHNLRRVIRRRPADEAA
jgi:CelD/BcsL family acetyltransferase involved in cellulose biosynthesis